MIFAIIAAAATVLTALAIHATRPEPRRIPIRIRDDRRPPRR